MRGTFWGMGCGRSVLIDGAVARVVDLYAQWGIKRKDMVHGNVRQL